MSSHSSSPSESDKKSIKSLLKQLAKDFQSLSHRKLQHEDQIIKDKKRKGCSYCYFRRGVENCERKG